MSSMFSGLLESKVAKFVSEKLSAELAATKPVAEKLLKLRD